MAHLYSLKIKYYRRIQNLVATFGDTKFVVLIGRGDITGDIALGQ